MKKDIFDTEIPDIIQYQIEDDSKLINNSINIKTVTFPNFLDKIDVSIQEENKTKTPNNLDLKPRGIRKRNPKSITQMSAATSVNKSGKKKEKSRVRRVSEIVKLYRLALTNLIQIH